MTRPLTLCDLDFTDLQADDDKDELIPRGLGNSVPPPPPPISIAPPPMVKPMHTNLILPPNFRQINGSKQSTTTTETNGNVVMKNKKTVSWNTTDFLKYNFSFVYVYSNANKFFRIRLNYFGRKCEKI